MIFDLVVFPSSPFSPLARAPACLQSQQGTTPSPDHGAQMRSCISHWFLMGSTASLQVCSEQPMPFGIPSFLLFPFSFCT